MNMRERQTFLWFSEQCPSLDRWLKDSAVAEYITSIRVYQVANEMIHLEFQTAAHQFSIITTAESEHAPTLMSFSFSERYGDRPMSKGDYEMSVWQNIEKDMLHIIQSGTSKSVTQGHGLTFPGGKY